MVGHRLSDQTKAKLREAMLGNRNPMFGKHFSHPQSDETKAKISQALKGSCNPMFGKYHSEATRAKMSLARTGNRNVNYGKHLSEETKAKLRATRLGKRLSEETRKKLSIAHLGGRQPSQKTGRKRAEKLFPCPSGLERHHIDGNTLNNSPENIALVTRAQHAKIDGRIAKANQGRLAKKL